MCLTHHKPNTDSSLCRDNSFPFHVKIQPPQRTQPPQTQNLNSNLVPYLKMTDLLLHTHAYVIYLKSAEVSCSFVFSMIHRATGHICTGASAYWKNKAACCGEKDLHFWDGMLPSLVTSLVFGHFLGRK